MMSEFKILNPQAFTNVFGDIPTLNNAELLDVQLRRDGPTLVVRLLTTEAIKIKPKRWDKWDVIYIEMSFGAVRDLTISGLGVNNQINQFEIQDVGEDGILEIKCNNHMHIKCSFDWAIVEGITPGLIGLP